MKNFQKLSFILLTFVLFTFSSCRTDQEEVPAPKPTNATKILGAWNTTKIEVTTNGMTSDATERIASCDIDNLLIFREDGIFNVDEGQTKCDSNAPQTTLGAWKLSSNEKKITIIEDDSTQVLTIIGIGKTQAQMSILEDFDSNGEEDIVTFTMIKE